MKPSALALWRPLPLAAPDTTATATLLANLRSTCEPIPFILWCVPGTPTSVLPATTP